MRLGIPEKILRVRAFCGWLRCSGTKCRFQDLFGPEKVLKLFMRIQENPGKCIGGNTGNKICGVFSERTPEQRISVRICSWGFRSAL
jgi:hypothetical protein